MNYLTKKEEMMRYNRIIIDTKILNIRSKRMNEIDKNIG